MRESCEIASGTSLPSLTAFSAERAPTLTLPGERESGQEKQIP
jgi:hypothetical protein